MRRVTVLFVLLVALPVQAEIYKCTLNGASQFSDRPCPVNAGEQTIVDIKKTNPAQAGAETSVEPTTSPKTAQGSGEALRDKLIGQWRYTGKLSGGSEDRTFYDDGRFKSYSKDDFAETTGTGTWSLDGKKLTITATFRNIMPSGEKVSVSNILRQTVKSIDDRVLVTHWPKYDRDSEWVRQ